MLERDIDQKVTKWAKKRKWFVWKVGVRGQNGLPDRMFISPQGLVCFIEFKAPGKRPTAAQLFQLEALRTRNIPATWFDDVDNAVEWLLAMEDKWLEMNEKDRLDGYVDTP